MRKLLALLCVLAATSAASAQPTETVISNASALVGVWKIAWPQWGRVGNAWGPMSDRFCRIEQAGGELSIRCFTNFQMGDGIGTVNLDGEMIHLAWGNMLIRNVFDGTVQSPTRIAGKMGVKFSGVMHENPAPSNGAKLPLSETADRPGKAALLRTALEQAAQGALTLPHDDAAMRKYQGASQGDLHALGTIKAVTYLGQGARALGTPDVDLDFFSVYAVEFDSGERLCGLHEGDDGRLEAIRCV